MNKFFIQSGIILAALISISGCTTHKISTAGETQKRTSGQSAAAQSTQNDNAQRLQKCLFEADQLSKIPGNKYATKKADLYKVIRAAKYYASISDNVTPSTSESLTPYYQFKVNDLCNEISWSMYNELKAGAATSEDSK